MGKTWAETQLRGFGQLHPQQTTWMFYLFDSAVFKWRNSILDQFTSVVEEVRPVMRALVKESQFVLFWFLAATSSSIGHSVGQLVFKMFPLFGDHSFSPRRMKFGIEA